jgi:hypothetical protein
MAIWARREEEESSRTLTPEVIQLLDAIDLTAVVLAPGEVPIYYSQSATNFGIIKGERIVPENLLALFRSVRRSGQSQEGEIEIPRGIGEGVYQLSVRVSKYGNQGLASCNLSR